MTEILICRHGEKIKIDGTSIDCISANGAHQVYSLGLKLKKENFIPDLIGHSGANRTRQSLHCLIAAMITNLMLGILGHY